jgi:hypothetical protein
MTDELGNRQLYRPRGRNQIEDLNILADCIAASDADLFDQGGGRVVGIDQGTVVGVTPAILLGIIAKNVAIKVPVNHGTESQPDWKVEIQPYQPDDATVVALITAKTLADGSLAPRLPKMPSEPRRLTPHEREASIMRLKTGEQPAAIATAYGVDVEMVKQLRR